MRRVGTSVVMFLLLTLLVGTGWALYRYVPGTLTSGDNSQPVTKSTTNQTADMTATSPLALAKPTATEGKNPKPSKIPASSPIDVALIDPKGTSVIAGSADPNSEVVVTADGKEVGKIKADSNGDWVLTTEHQFKSPAPDIGVETRKPTQVAKAASPDQLADTVDIQQKETSDTKPASVKEPAREKDVKVVERLTEEFEKIVEAARQEESAQPPVQEKRAVAAQVPDQNERVVAEHTPENKPSASVTVTDTTPAVAAPEEQDPVTPVIRAEPDTTSPTQHDNTVGRVAVQTPKATKEINKPAAIPIPIGFVYKTATFTEQGKKAAQLLSEYLAIKKPNSISLTGHADERGSKQLNMKLSIERLDAVAREVKTHGYSGKLVLIPKGEEEPYAGVDRSKLEKQELYALDRRVELKLYE